MKKLAESDLKLIRKDLLKIDAPSFAIYLGSLEMQFTQEKGYHYKELTVEAIFEKQARYIKCGGDVIVKNLAKNDRTSILKRIKISLILFRLGEQSDEIKALLRSLIQKRFQELCMCI